MDWNLIPTLEALLNERSVSGAARRLGLSQPAVSNALSRLRRQFNDELLIRRGTTYVLTPFAERLATSTRLAVDAMATVAQTATQFEPADSTRTFVVAASDYVQAVIGAELAAAIHRRAPLARLSFLPPFGNQFQTNIDIVEQTDGWFAPREMLPGHPHLGLLPDRWVCVVADNHPGIGDVLTLDDAKTYPWVAPMIRGNPLGVHLDDLAAHGIEPDVEITTEHFTAVPFLVAGSQRIGMLQESLARRLAPAAAVRVLACPWPVQPLQLTFWWSQRREADPGHAWFRTVVDDTIQQAHLPRK